MNKYVDVLDITQIPAQGPDFSESMPAQMVGYRVYPNVAPSAHQCALTLSRLTLPFITPISAKIFCALLCDIC